MSHKISREMVMAALTKVVEADVSLTNDVCRISSVIIRDNNVGFAVEVEKGEQEPAEQLRQQCEEAVKCLPGVGKVTAVLTAHNSNPTMRQQKEALKEVRKEQRLKSPPQPVEGVQYIIAVASGKGGVGKSTVAVNLAVALAKSGIRTGLLDADIYGPSIPMMMGIKGKPELKGNKMVPPVAHGVQCISMGMLLDDDKALAWRGSMATKALFQLFRGTCWDNVEVLVVDMPPGTGDVHISLAENYPISGAVVVSTPQDIAVLDAKKAVDMFRKVDIPVLGLVENMAYFQDPASGNCSYIFGEKGVEGLASQTNLEVLTQVPLGMAIREGGDNGEPVMVQTVHTILQKPYEILGGVIRKYVQSSNSAELSPQGNAIKAKG